MPQNKLRPHSEGLREQVKQCLELQQAVEERQFAAFQHVGAELRLKEVGKLSFLFKWDGVKAAFTEWMATQYSPNRKGQALYCAVYFKCFERVMRARRLESTF